MATHNEARGAPMPPRLGQHDPKQPIAFQGVALFLPVVRQYSDRCANHVANTSRTERNDRATTLTTRLFFELSPKTAGAQARAGN
jgi:hypothetical protein